MSIIKEQIGILSWNNKMKNLNRKNSIFKDFKTSLVGLNRWLELTKETIREVKYGSIDNIQSEVQKVKKKCLKQNTDP